MAGRIPQNFIDDLIARTDIVDLIDGYVKLKKKGGSYRAKCPFHNGNNDTSFSVNDKEQYYHCFNCGAAGSVVSFVMEYEGLEYIDTIEFLAEKMGVDVPREATSHPGSQPAPYVDRKDMYLLMGDITKFYQQQLKQHKNSAKVINYLKGRGLSGETVKHFKIGYAPDSWDAVCKRFSVTPEIQKQLIDAGMIKRRENSSGSYDFFNDRLMFPILDRRGRVIAFGGRVFDHQEPKYLNSPETPIFHKGQELYGLYQVKQAHKDCDRILVVEGYMDVVALAQFGIDYAVASLGTATTPDHIKLLFRNTANIVCCFDGDSAGKKAAWRALENALPHLQDGRSMHFMFLEDGEDPDSYIQKNGKEAFEEAVLKAKPLSDFLFENLLSQVDMGSSDTKTKLMELARPLFRTLNQSTFKEIMTERLAKNMGMELEGLKRYLAMAQSSSKKKPQQKISPMRLIISILLKKPTLGFELPLIPEFYELEIPGINLLNPLLEICRTHPHITTGQLLEHWRDKPSEHKQLTTLAIWENNVQEDNYEAVFYDTLDSFIQLYISRKIEILKQKERTGTTLTSNERIELARLIVEQIQNQKI
ncbi:MAG TPA: DNA primase [Psychromonas hadalis]|nr:DNA primase [Psychromonas hadalis]